GRVPRHHPKEPLWARAADYPGFFAAASFHSALLPGGTDRLGRRQGCGARASWPLRRRSTRPSFWRGGSVRVCGELFQVAALGAAVGLHLALWAAHYAGAAEEAAFQGAGDPAGVALGALSGVEYEAGLEVHGLALRALDLRHFGESRSG